ncbi:hypothetical protein HHI36_020060 [Cryptolaemus montrouzieri]|uniref:Ubiquitin carboxyl-terminal hydrolase 47 n=1 Tax=Cryptolaemus montrouzieri TaxID=559131 RepID=A0ABD2N931_9CUCU
MFCKFRSDQRMLGQSKSIVEVVKSVDDTPIPQSLGFIELDPNLKVDGIFKWVQNHYHEQENVMDEVEIFLEGKGKRSTGFILNIKIRSIFKVTTRTASGTIRKDFKINLNPYKDKMLKDIGISCSSVSEYKVRVTMPKQRMALCVQEVIEDDLLLGASASPTTAEVFNRGSEFYNNDPLPSLTSDDEYGLATQGPSNVDTINYVGLVNQAMTCYLNSLLQALYMTPEFRNALYNWEFDGQNESRSIPFQLQKLFLNLQTSSKSAVETTDLTTSFGWQGSDAWQQHDIQELCRVMFDALEQKFKDTKQANLINDLYEGKMLDYVRCLECSTEKSREDTFLDIPLPVRPFGSQVAYNSVEEALRAFVQPEILDGNNQYHCEKCNKKCNAHKGLKFTKFPYLLTLHLKRFDFDYNTLHRIKLNDKVVFSEVLNLNSFIQNNNTPECEEQVEDKDNIAKYDDCCTTDSGSALEDEGCQSADASSTANGQDVNCSESDEGIDVSSGNNHKIEAKGPYIYDLFSIMIHSGSATGGHYYAYIKDFEKQHWYCFNDQSVMRITEDDIKKTYGGNPHRGYYSGAYSSSTNAYMLMYRQIDKDRNIKAMSVDDFPIHIRNLLKQMREKEENDRKIKEKENDLVKIIVYCYHPVERRLLDAKVSVFIDNTLEETVAFTAHQRFKLEGIVAKEDCRLVKYNKFQDCIDFSFDSDQIKFCDIASDIDISSSEWFLEIRQPNTEWQVYKPGAVNMIVYPINLQLEELGEPTVIRVNVNETIGELKQRLSLLLNQPKDPMEVVIEKFAELIHFDRDDQVINFEFKNISYKLYVANVLDEEPEKTFQCSKLRKFIEKIRQVIALRISLPEVDIGTLETLSIPSLDANQNIDRLDMATGDRNSPNLRVSPQQVPSAICCDGFGDQSNSEDSSLSDSDRTLVGDAPGEGMGLSSNSSNSPADQHMVSPTDPAEDSYNYDVLGNPTEEMHWDDDETEEAHRINSFYFKMVHIVNEDATDYRPCSRYCKVLVDKRITLDRLKKHLEPYVRVPVEYFKVYKQIPTYSIPSEDELQDLNDTLKCMKYKDCLSIKLGRVLRIDEYNVKVHILRPNHQEAISFLFDHIVAKGQTVGQVHKEIIIQAKKRHMLDLTHHKSRLREKGWKKAKKVLLEHQVFGDDIPLTSGGIEICLQELDDVEKVKSANQTVFFVRRWRPSILQLDLVQEVVVNSTAIEELKANIAQMSGIPLENCEIALVKPNLPGDMHRLEIHNDLDWKPSSGSFEDWPLYASDGSIFYYR